MARDTASIDCGKNEGEMQCVGYVTGRGVKFSRDRNLEDMMDDGIGTGY